MGRKYTAEFKEQASQLVRKPGYSVTRAAQELGIPQQTLSRWVAQRGGRVQAEQPMDSDDPKTLQARIRDLEARLRRVEMEKDILKKATAYFAKENL